MKYIRKEYANKLNSRNFFFEQQKNSKNEVVVLSYNVIG